MSMSIGSPELQSFPTFVKHWLVQQNKYLEKLISVSKHHTSTEIDKRSLINGVIEHYEQYYETKSSCVTQDVLGMLTPSWTSTLEDAFMWIGGWRPTMAFHLFYSKSGLQLDGQLANQIRGLGTCDLGDLAPTQLTRVDELQRITIREERDMTEKMAKIQETVADESMVELSHTVTELIISGGPGGDGDGDGVEERVELALALKEEVLEEILLKADNLRLRTLKAILDVFTPIQAVHFLIAAAELHLRVHDWGMEKDASQVHGICRA
ncbi:protein DOG1-like 4 [Corylus avellana]|uniref:protein DOG1-like 4 n=1 Tax=Corylus avellana TaxID=13451 RepID=UPI001E224311|nr:protein DOG1-like 4 [Corylus avellana]